MKKLTTLLFSALFFLTVGINNLKAQCHNYPQGFYDLIDSTPVIFEGEAIGKRQSFVHDGNIYTTHAIKVYKVLKGNIDVREVEIIHRGGVVNGRSVSTPFDTNPFKGETGIYMVFPAIFESPTDVSQNLKFRIYSSCYFLSYEKWIAKRNPKDGTLNGPMQNAFGLNSLEDIEEKVYKPIRKKVGYKYKEVQPLEKKNGGLKNPGAKGGAGYAKSNDTLPIPQITGFYPDTLTAGTFDTLTIEGCNFDTVYTGNIRVAFLNA